MKSTVAIKVWQEIQQKTIALGKAEMAAHLAEQQLSRTQAEKAALRAEILALGTKLDEAARTLADAQGIDPTTSKFNVESGEFEAPTAAPVAGTA